MIPNPSKKNKIVLTDYDYRRDIENRLLMSSLSVFDVEVLEEVLMSSLSLTVTELGAELDSSADEIVPTLDKLAKMSLLTVQGDQIKVDKDMRRYYDAQIEKFDDNFRPDMDYMQSLLGKVPIQHLPAWYALPRTTENIFESIVERYLKTPRIYRRYVDESQFDDPVVTGIIDAIYKSPDFKVRSRDLREQFQLTRETFEEYMLHLEFNFICCLHYNRIDDQWKEVVTPYWPVWQYLRYLRDTEAPSIDDVDQIQRDHDSDFDFIEKLADLVRQPENLTKYSEAEQEELIDKIQCMGLAAYEDGALRIRNAAQDWLRLPAEDRAMILYRHPDFQLSEASDLVGLTTERNLRRVERGIRRVLESGWVLFEDFMKGFHRGLGSSDGAELKKSGRSWKYDLPTYSDNDVEFVRRVIFERMTQVGLVATGTFEGKPCFTLTDFGRHTFAK